MPAATTGDSCSAPAQGEDHAPRPGVPDDFSWQESEGMRGFDNEAARRAGQTVVGFIKDPSFGQGPAAICSGRLYRCIIPGGRVPDRKRSVHRPHPERTLVRPVYGFNP